MGADRRRAPARALVRHDVARLDRDHVAVTRLVRAGARTHVDDGLGVAERRVDARGELGVLATHPRVPAADRVVPGRALGHQPEGAVNDHDDETLPLRSTDR